MKRYLYDLSDLLIDFGAFTFFIAGVLCLMVAIVGIYIRGLQLADAWYIGYGVMGMGLAFARMWYVEHFDTNYLTKRSTRPLEVEPQRPSSQSPDYFYKRAEEELALLGRR